MTSGIKYVATLPPGGYAEAAKRAMLGLVAAGIPVTFMPLVEGKGLGLTLEPYHGNELADPQLKPLCNRPIPYDTVIFHCPPELFPRLAPAEAGKSLLGATVWETDRLPAKWLPWLEAVDRIIVPCRWNKAVFEVSGVRRPVETLPHICLADSGGLPPPLELDAEGRFVFYSIGVWSGRKGLARLVRAYLAAFTRRDAVTLVLKTSARDLTWITPWGAPRPTWLAVELARWHAGSRARINVLTQDLSEAQMRSLHAQGDCYASLPNGEGWGLGSFDAAAAGNPVITTGYGAPLEYLGADYPHLVRHQVVPAQARGYEKAIFSPEQNWAQPDEADAIRHLREVFTRPHLARDFAREVQGRLHSRYNAERMTVELLEIVRRARRET